MPASSFPRSPRGLLAIAATLALAALAVRVQTRWAERANPPRGRLLDVDGVAMHVMEYSSSAPQTLVLLHGNGLTGEDFDVAGLVALAGPRWRVISIDRPGFGHSGRPKGRRFDPETQADLVHGALQQLQVGPAVVLGHSLGAQVALALALRHPEWVRSLVLASGYYRPSAAISPWLTGGAALPVVGTVWRNTLAPLVGRLAWPLVARRLFAPAPVTSSFREGLPLGLVLRPSQLRATAIDSLGMFAAARRLGRQLRDLHVPAVIVAGSDDRLLSSAWHSQWLQRHLPGSRLHMVAGVGHMVHHSATAEVMNAVEEAEALLPQPAQALIGDPHEALRAGVATPGITPPRL